MTSAAVFACLLLDAVVASAQGPSASQSDQGSPFTVRVTTREVVVEVIARDRHNHPVRDLSQNDFQVYEIPGSWKKALQSISNFRMIDPGS